MVYFLFFSENVNNPSPKKYVRTDENTQDEIKKITNMISSNDWKERHHGIGELLAFCETHAQVVAVNATKVKKNICRQQIICVYVSFNNFSFKKTILRFSYKFNFILLILKMCTKTVVQV